MKICLSNSAILVSIRAPRVEGRLRLSSGYELLACFNPRPPRGGATRGRSAPRKRA